MSLKNPGKRYVIYNKDNSLKTALIGTKNSKTIKKAKRDKLKYEITQEFNKEELKLIFKDISSEQFIFEFIDIYSNFYTKKEINILFEITNLKLEDIINSEYFTNRYSEQYKVLKILNLHELTGCKTEKAFIKEAKAYLIDKIDNLD